MSVVNSFEQWSSSHWGWLLGIVIVCLLALSAIFVSLSGVREAEADAIIEDDND